MKIRTSFISNSSSSSFILAMRKGCTIVDIKNEILADDKSLTNFINIDLEYAIESEDQFEGLEGDELKDTIASELAGDIFTEFKWALVLDDWKVVALEASNEDSGYLLGSYLYSMGNNFNSDKIKSKGYN